MINRLKIFVALVTSYLIVASKALALAINLRDGTSYDPIKIIEISPLGIVIEYKSEEIFIDYAEIIPQELVQYGFNKTAYFSAKNNGDENAESNESNVINSTSQDPITNYKQKLTVTLRSGRTFQFTKVKRYEPLGVVFELPNGISFIDYSLFAPQLLPELNFDKQKYDDEVKRKTERQAMFLAEKRTLPTTNKSIADRDYASREYQSDAYVNRNYSTNRNYGSSDKPALNMSRSVHVSGYYRKNGTYVRPHTRSR